MSDEARIKELEDKVENIEKEFARYRGFVGGVVFVLGAIWAFIELVAPQLLTFIKRLVS